MNDARYAAAYSSYRRDTEKFGRMRVVTDLKAKGVHGDVIEKAVASVYDGVKEEELARAICGVNASKNPKTRKGQRASSATSCAPGLDQKPSLRS